MTVLSSLVRNYSHLCTKLLSASSNNAGCIFPSIYRATPVKSNFFTGPCALASFGTRSNVITKDDKRDFMALFPDIVRDIKEHIEKNEVQSRQSDLSNLVAKIMQYNVSRGKKLRGLTAVHSFRMLASEEDFTPENIRLSQILGWAIEMIQGFFLIIDDFTDGSTTRRGHPCWYTLEDVKLRAATDAVVLQTETFHLLKKNFRNKSYYLQLLEMFIDTIRKTAYGQAIDHCSSLRNITELTMDRYNYITKFKTSYYTFILPVGAGMYMAGIQSEELHRQSKNVLQQIGHYFQVQDDFLDTFGDIEVTGKEGTDIQDGKCTWLAVVALQRASASQQSILKECYGKMDPEKVAAVKNIYIELGLPSVYHAYEEEIYNLIIVQIQQLSAGLPHELFLTLLHRIYGRKR